MHLPQDLEKLLQGHFGKILNCTMLYRSSFWKIFSFGKDMAIWSPMNELWFFWIFCLLFFWPYFKRYQHYRAAAVLLRLYWSPAFIWQKISTKSDNKKFLVWKSKPIPLKYLQYSKLKKFCQIKNVNMQIDRNGIQKRCTLNRLKIFQKLRLPWLFKVHRIMRNIWKLELALITLKSANVVGKLISCPF